MMYNFFGSCFVDMLLLLVLSVVVFLSMLVKWIVEIGVIERVNVVFVGLGDKM